jgi:twinkle protein
LPSADLLVAHKHMPPPMVMFTGIATVDAILKIPGEGRVIVVTGVPNSGKTNWVLNAMVHLQRKYGRKFAVFSPEAGPWLDFLAGVSQILTDKPFHNRGGFVAMTDDEARAAAEWFLGKLFWVGGDEEVPTMAWLLDTAKLLVMRYGITDFIIDPFNEVEPGDDAASETKYIGRCLQMARKFGERYGVNVWIVAHPKMLQKEKDGKIPIPGPYDISGSAHWANKADLGITIHTPDETTFLILWKSRYSRWGRKNNQAPMKYDVVTGRYFSDAPPMPYSD